MDKWSANWDRTENETLTCLDYKRQTNEISFSWDSFDAVLQSDDT